METKVYERWCVGYYVGNTYKHKYIKATTSGEAIKKAKIKNIVELYPVNDNNERIG
jgi:hypothetical protein